MSDLLRNETAAFRARRLKKGLRNLPICRFGRKNNTANSTRSKRGAGFLAAFGLAEIIASLAELDHSTEVVGLNLIQEQLNDYVREINALRLENYNLINAGNDCQIQVQNCESLMSEVEMELEEILGPNNVTMENSGSKETMIRNLMKELEALEKSVSNLPKKRNRRQIEGTELPLEAALFPFVIALMVMIIMMILICFFTRNPYTK
jgi:regulator of replication initiation timing